MIIDTDRALITEGDKPKTSGQPSETRADQPSEER